MQAHFRTITVPALLLLAAGCATGSGDRPRWAEAPDSDLASRETFSWEDHSGPPPGTVLHKRIRDAIRGELEGEGGELWLGTTEALGERPEAAAIDRAVAALMAAFSDRGPESP